MYRLPLYLVTCYGLITPTASLRKFVRATPASGPGLVTTAWSTVQRNLVEKHATNSILWEMRSISSSVAGLSNRLRF
jgi:hypothetical protein